MVVVALVAIAAVCSSVFTGLRDAPTYAARNNATTKRMGFYPGYADVVHLASLESLIGRDAKFVVQFGDTRASSFTASIWGQVLKAGALQTLSKQITLVESIPLAFGASIDASTARGRATARLNLQATVSGANDVMYRTVAGYLVSGGFPDAILRLGWEFDGTWMPWSAAGNEALFVSAYQHVADIFRAASGKFRFDWSGDPGHLQNELAAYPGDKYVDIVGMDVYDKAVPVAWNAATKTWVDPNAAFSWIRGSLQFQLDFAKSHKKSVSYPEWALTGVASGANGSVGGDDPAFIQGMRKWMDGLRGSGAGSLAYHAYFDEDTNDGHHRIDSSYFPNALAQFTTLFASKARAAG